MANIEFLKAAALSELDSNPLEPRAVECFDARGNYLFTARKTSGDISGPVQQVRFVDSEAWTELQATAAKFRNILAGSDNFEKLQATVRRFREIMREQGL